MAVNGADPYELLAQLCVLSDSQEELLRCCSFAGNPNSVAVGGGGGSASSDSQFLPPHPSGVLAPSLKRSEQIELLSPNYAYQPPPEQSVGQPPIEAAEGGEEVNAEDGCVCDVATGVDLGKNPDLGFPFEVQSQQMETEIEIIGGVCGRAIAESESTPVVVNLDLGDSIEEEIRCMKKKRKLGNFQEIRYLDPWRRNLNASKENEDDGSGNLTCSVLEILKIVGEKENEGLDEDLGNRNLLEIVSDRGMTFPRPCWWPEGEDFEFK